MTRTYAGKTFTEANADLDALLAGAEAYAVATFQAQRRVTRGTLVDADVVIEPGGDSPYQLGVTPLTVGRTITLGAVTVADAGKFFHLARSSASTGAFVYTVKSWLGATLTTLAVAEWAVLVVDDTGTWQLARRGSLAFTDSSLSALRAVSPWALMIDATEGVTDDGHGNVATVTDLSGNHVTVSLVSNIPLYGPTKWRGAQPAIQFQAGNHHRLQVGGDASWTTILGPFTVITILDAFSDDGTHDANIYRDNSAINSVGYIAIAGGQWNLYDGTIFGSAFTQANRPGPNIRIDVHNGAASAIWANGTKQVGDAGTSARALGTFFIGSNTANLAPMNGIMPFFGVIPSAISDVQADSIISILRARYQDIPAV